MLRDFWGQYPDVKGQAEAWHAEVERATWKTPAELKDKYGSASFIDDKRVVFNLCGNKYRLLVWVNYKAQRVYTRWIGTHKEYDKLDMGKL